jgi:DNA-binding IclR family transcriptional regulator
LIQSLARGIEILSILERKGSVAITEIAEELGVDKSSASRLIHTLTEYDMVRLDPVNKKYRLGFRILFLSDGIHRTIDVASTARLYMYKICDLTHASVHLAAHSNGMCYVIDQVRSKHKYNLAAHVGMIESWHCSAVGKCVLAYMPSSVVEMILHEHELTPYTVNTITDPAELKEELNDIREQGYAVDNEERALGVCCIAAPIFSHNGHVDHCIGTSGPAAQINSSNIREYARVMMEYAKQISKELGYGLFGKRGGVI